MTQQKRDIVHFKNSNFYILDDLLCEYFEAFPDRMHKTPFIMTSLWRGYFAEFEIINAEFLIRSLKRFIHYDRKNNEFVVEDVTEKSFPLSKKLDFITAFIRADENYSNSPEKPFRFIKIENGNLMQEIDMDYSEYLKLKNETTIRMY